MNIESMIRVIPDYPKPGIHFRDITTLLKDPRAYHQTISLLASHYEGLNIQKIIGIESRGFIFGASLADRLKTGFVPIRKKGKLPHKTFSQEYSLEYGTDTIEVHADAVEPGENVLIIDDLIATGGTALASYKLMKQLGANLIGFCCIIDLPDLGGSKLLKLEGIDVFTLCSIATEPLTESLQG